MRLKYCLDEDSADAALVMALRSRGLVVVTSADSGLLGASDLVQLTWCSREGFVLVTHNVGDFFALHGWMLHEGKEHGGLVLMRQQTMGVGEKLRRLVKLADQRSAEEMKNHVEFLSVWA